MIMARDKKYDYMLLKEQNKALDIDYGKAIQRLNRMFMLHMAKQLGLDKCYQCGQIIDDYTQMTIEHKEPWRKSELQEYKPELFWNMNNLALSHHWCNCGAATRGTNKLGYLCVDEFIDKRKGGEYRRYRARHTISKKTITLGYFNDLIEAAIAADIGVMRFRNGCGPLNFEHLRDQYKEYLNSRFKPDEEIFYKRGPIKSIVQHFIKLI
jgi:hypothetical protein